MLQTTDKTLESLLMEYIKVELESRYNKLDYYHLPFKPEVIEILFGKALKNHRFFKDLMYFVRRDSPLKYRIYAVFNPQYPDKVTVDVYEDGFINLWDW